MDVEISVVIPVYNASRSISEVVQRCLALEWGPRLEIILVEDGSQDPSGEIVRRIEREDPRVRVLIHPRNLGQQTSIRDGLAMARGRYVVTMDDDLQQDPEDIRVLYEKIKEGYDVVYGLPQREGYPIHRTLGSKWVDGFFTRFMGKPKEVKVGSYRIMNRKTVDQVIGEDPSFVYITAMLLQHTQNMSNVPVAYRPRPYGQTNYNWRSLFRLFCNLFFYYGWKGRKGGKP